MDTVFAVVAFSVAAGVEACRKAAVDAGAFVLTLRILLLSSFGFRMTLQDTVSRTFVDLHLRSRRLVRHVVQLLGSGLHGMKRKVVMRFEQEVRIVSFE